MKTKNMMPGIKWIILIVVALCFNKEIYCIGNETTLNILPSDITCTVNSEFEILVKVSNVENLFAVAFDVVYDTTMISFQGISEGDFLNENGQEETFFLWNAQPGKIIVAVSRTDNSEPGVSTESEKTLVKMSFNAIAFGTTYLNLENAGLMDTALVQMPFQQQNGMVHIFGQPVIAEIPEQNINMGDTIIISLNDYVHDPDTPTNLLTWEVMEAPYLYYNVDNTNNTLAFWPAQIFEETSLAIKVSDPEGFSDQATIRIVMPVGIDEIGYNSNQIRVYPNPFTDRITIEVDGNAQTNNPLNISIWSIAGIEKGTLQTLHVAHNGRYTIYLNENEWANKKLTDGLYFLRIELDGEYQIIKVIKSGMNN